MKERQANVVSATILNLALKGVKRIKENEYKLTKNEILDKAERNITILIDPLFLFS